MKKNKKFLSFRRTSGIKIEITIKDEDWRVIDTFKANIKDLPKIIGIIKRQYGINFRPEVSNSPNGEKDLNWLRKKGTPF